MVLMMKNIPLELAAWKKIATFIGVEGELLWHTMAPVDKKLCFP
jgi:hypothetical protein